jgi:CheY-like chemotaxis protein
MTPEVLNKVCEPFFTTKPMGRGTGLGMAVTHGIITGHGGRLALASQPGRGASVTVYLPFAETGTAAANAQPTDTDAQARPAALVVDDEPDVLDFVAEVLGEKNCEVLTAKNGEGALEIFRDNGLRLALAVIDRHLPDMQGADLALKIKQQFPRCGVIIMSGDNAPAPEPADADPLAPVFLNKPFLIDELLSLASPFLDNA